MVYRKKEDGEDCVQYSGDEWKNKGLTMDRFGVYVVYCDEDDEDEE